MANLLVRKRGVNEKSSSTRINGSCKQATEHKTQLKYMEKTPF